MDANQRTVVKRPAAGTRPSNRRRLIIDAAADLFYQRGYSIVTMSNVADAVAIGPSALYRYFPSKHALLATVIEDAVSWVDGALESATRADDLATILATVFLSRRSVGVLWRRETRHLAPEDRQRLHDHAKRVRAQLAAGIRRRRPGVGNAEGDFMAACALGVANSVSFHRIPVPGPAFAALLSGLIAVPLNGDIELARASSDGRRPESIPRSRRETILSAATVLFAENGYSGVSVDDIGAAVGISGPSVYNHFPTKAEVLVAATSRGNESLWMAFNRAVAGTDDAEATLRNVVHGYRVFTFDNPDIVEILLSDVSHLPESERQRIVTAQRAYIDEWVHLVRGLHPEWTPTTTRVRVQACQMMINDIAVSSRLRNLSGVGSVLDDFGVALLSVECRDPDGVG